MTGGKIYLTPCCEDGALYFLMAKEYVNELQRYDESLRWESVKGAWESGIAAAWFIRDGERASGFIVLEDVLFSDRAIARYIGEIYIDKERRGNGLGLSAAREATRGREEVFFYVLDKNEPAKRFWDRVAEELNWEIISREEIRQEPGCEIRNYLTR